MNYNTIEVVYIHPVYNVCETVKAKVNLNRSSRSGYLSSLLRTFHHHRNRQFL